MVGGGGAGLAAAIEARAAGASVVLLEKNARLGGSTARSIGSISATGTPHQKRRGIDDNPADHWADMPGFAGELAARDNDALRRILCDEAPAAFQWLLDSGIRFMGPMPERPHRKPRMHNVLPNSRAYIYHLERRAGVQIRTGTRVADLERRDGRARRLPPWRALASGMAWALEHLPQALLRPFVMQFVTTQLAPSPALFEAGAILVNREGQRFGDERDRPAYRVPDQPGKVAYIVIDGALARRFSAWPDFISTAPGVAYAYLPDYRRNRRDVYAEASTLAELARRIGMPGLEAAFTEPPFIALGPVRSVFVHAEGGLAVDESHRVLGADGEPIPGLYAAGATGQGGLLLKGHGHHLAWAFVSGRRAGRFAALSGKGA